MADEQFANDGISTLSSAINSSVTSITLVSAAKFPTIGDFSIKIDNEILRVTNVAGNVFTVTRGTESTTAASHTSGSTVANILTKQSLINWRQYTNYYDSANSRPSSGSAYYPKIGFVISVYDGANWKDFGPIYTNITFNNFQFIHTYNSSDSSQSTSFNSFVLIKPGSAGDDVTLRTFEFNFISTWIIRVLLLPNPNISSPDWEMGICLFDNTSNKFKTFGFRSDRKLVTSKWTDFTTFSADYNEYDLESFPPYLWLALEYDGTNLYYKISTDNVKYHTLESRDFTDFCTPNEHGIYLNSANNKENTLRVLSYLETENDDDFSDS